MQELNCSESKEWPWEKYINLEQNRDVQATARGADVFPNPTKMG